MSEFAIFPVVSRMFDQNCWIVHRVGQSNCIVVDPGFDVRRIDAVLTERGLVPEVLLLTHGHVDHIAGVSHLKRRFPAAPVVIGRGDAPMLTDPELNLSGLGGVAVTAPEADRLLEDGERVEFAGIEFRVAWIPGHSPGHVVFIHEESSPAHVVGGDVLFSGSIGRTDFPGGSLPQLLAGIRQHLWPLPDTTVVYPGHGPTTTIGEEKRTNPYCGQGALDVLAD